MFRNKRRFIVAVLLFVFLIIVCTIIYRYRDNVGKPDLDTGIYYKVTKVIDGDTFNIFIEEEKREATIRVLGINTPETVDERKEVECYGPEASKKAKEILNGKNIKLSWSPDREYKDKYNRYLAYVYIDDFGSFGEYMLKYGFAREYTYGKPYSKREEYRRLESLAKAKSLGLWGQCID